MNMIDLPRDILSHILSYNMYPFCNRVCRYLSSIEDSLHMYRYRKICNGDKDISNATGCIDIRNSIKNSDWESFSFISSYIWNINNEGSKKRITEVLLLLQSKNRNDIVNRIIRNYSVCIILDRDAESYKYMDKVIAGASRSVIDTLYSRGMNSRIIQKVMTRDIIIGRLKNVRYYINKYNNKICMSFPSSPIYMSSILLNVYSNNDKVASDCAILHFLSDIHRYRYVPIDKIIEDLSSLSYRRYNVDYKYTIKILESFIRGTRCNCDYCYYKQHDV